MRKFISFGLTLLLLCGTAYSVFAADKESPAKEDYIEVPIKPLKPEELKELLAKRFNGGLGNDFKSFANVFFVSSVLSNLGKMVSLSTKSKKIASLPLEPVYPQGYQPTLKEFLDVIALETGSTWRYDPDAKASSTSDSKKAIENCAVFVFEESERKLPYKLKMAEGWKKRTRAHSVIYMPPVFPVGMDIYQMGAYSSDDKSKEAEVLEKAKEELSMTWAKALYKEAKKEDLKSAKVGKYDAVYFEKDIKAKNGAPIRWRQWVFMVGNQCYMVHSTIVPKMEERLYPEVKAMLDSFEVLKNQDSPKAD